MRKVDSSLIGGPISFMARHPVASNLLMLVLLIGGIIFAYRIKQEVFPDLQLDIVTVQISYPGASPEEVERGITLAVEEAVSAIPGVKKVTSRSAEGGCIVFVQMLLGTDANRALQDVKSSVDRILTFPQEAQRPVISLLEPKRQVLSIIAYGPFEEATLRDLGEKIREDLLLLEGITSVTVRAVPRPEIAIEVPKANLRAYHLTLGDVANVIRQTSIELPGGSVKAPSGEVLLRTQERRDYASQFAGIPLLSRNDGSKVYVSDIAEVMETYKDNKEEAYFNGERAVRVDVYRIGDQGPLAISDAARGYVERLAPMLPPGLSVTIWDDESQLFRDRMQLLVVNGMQGLLLVLIILGLFLEPRLAFWVALGIPVSIIGSFFFIAQSEASINMVSLFAFIITLGIVVDDGIVVGEEIYYKREQGMPALKAAILGARAISGPVLFAVLTNMASFFPLLFIPGVTGKIFLQIPSITIAVFAISLVESLYVLPSHLSHEPSDNWFWRQLNRPNKWFNRGLKRFKAKVYKPVATVSFHHPWVVISTGTALLLICLGLVTGGYISFGYLPQVDGDLVTAKAVMTYGVPIEKARALQESLVKHAREVIAENGGDGIVKGIYSLVGADVTSGSINLPSTGEPGTHLVTVQVMLGPSEERAITGVQFADLWRDHFGQAQGLESLIFTGAAFIPAGSPIDVQLSHRDRATLEAAALEVADALRPYVGVKDVDAGVTRGKEQMTFKLTPAARSLGLTSRDLAEQVRHAFYGAEALRQQRGRDEVKVLVRLPEPERATAFTVDELVLRSPTGAEIPLSEAAEIERGKAYIAIQRSESKRILSVKANVEEGVANAADVLAELTKTTLPAVVEKYPGLAYSFEGEQRERTESLANMYIGFACALIAIYALLAIPFGSYIQPLIVMLSIPFGMIGAFIGHVLLGYDLSIISMLGIVALAGVVVNDALVLVVTANDNVQAGQGLIAAVRAAGVRRFRPIILTSLTTFFGLAPIIFEKSQQARFLIPMAISLGFGIIFSTVIALILVPSVYLVVTRLTRRGHRG